MVTVKVIVCVDVPGSVTGFPVPPPVQAGAYVADAPAGELVSEQIAVTVPAKPPTAATVTVEVAVAPGAMAAGMVGVRLNVDSALTNTTPVEGACVTSPEYAATRVCEPPAEKLVAYVNAPATSVSETGVPASTVTDTVPVGTVVPVVETTAMVKLSETFTDGEEFDAVTDVVVSMGHGATPVLAGHAQARLYRSTVPSPVTWS